MHQCCRGYARFFTDNNTTPTKLFCFVLCCWLDCGNYVDNKLRFQLGAVAKADQYIEYMTYDVDNLIQSQLPPDFIIKEQTFNACKKCVKFACPSE